MTFCEVSSASTTKIFMGSSPTARCFLCDFIGTPGSSHVSVTLGSDYRHLVQGRILLQSSKGVTRVTRGVVFRPMTDPKFSGTGADWTQLLTDPALVSHLGELLQVYREAAPDKRDEALLQAMRNIKGSPAKAAEAAQAAASKPVPVEKAAPMTLPPAAPVTTSPAASPPFEPDIFTPTW